MGAKIGKRFLRPLQDSLDRPAGNAELLGDGLDGLPCLMESEDAIPVENPRRTPQALSLGADLAV